MKKYSFCLVQEEESSVHAVAFSPDGQYIVVTLAFLFSKFQFQGFPAVHGPRSQHAQVGCGDKSVKARVEVRESTLCNQKIEFLGPGFNGSVPVLYPKGT